MKKNSMNFADIVKDLEPLNQSATGEMTGGFTPFGGQDVMQSHDQNQTLIMNGILVVVLGSSCACTCECAC